jgi:DNA-binding CsgD family transcriptional regulator
MSPALEVVGRESEIDSVHDFLEAVPAGPITMLIEGEIGIGKTTLWREGVAAADERGLQVLACRPVEGEIALPFAALGDLLEGVPEDVLARLPEPQREALEIALLRVETRPGRLRGRAVALGVLGAFRVLAEDSPLVVAIDDVQWLDAPSADALTFAARRLRGEAIGFLVARRADTREGPLEPESALESGRVWRLLVHPLDLQSLDRLLRTRLDKAFLRPALVELQRVSGGNPFFALELARALLARDVSLAPGDPLPVPPNLHELVRERLAVLPAAAREAALVVSALSRPTVALVAAAATRGDGEAALEKAEAAGVVELAHDRIRFSHPLLASVVYAQAPGSRRRALHARLAEIVDDADERARHLALAATGPDPQVAAAVDDAARRAWARGASQAAAELWERARRLTPPDDAEGWRRAVEAAECHLEAGDTDRARVLLEDVVARLPPGPGRAGALTRLAWVGSFGRGFHVGADLFRAALAEIGDDLALRTEIERGLAWSIHEIGDMAAAEAHARAALEMAERLGEPALLASALADMAFFETVRGRGIPTALIERALELERKDEWRPFLGRFGPVWIQAVLLEWAGDLDAARSTLEALRQSMLAQGEHSEHSVNYLAFQLGRVECLAGNWELAARYAEECFEATLQTGQEDHRPYALTIKALVDAHLGRVAEARAATDEGLPLALHVGVLPAHLEMLGIRGFLEHSLGDAREAHRFLGPLPRAAAEAGYGEPTLFRFHGDAIETLLELGEQEPAATLLADLEGVGTALERVWAQTIASRCRALLNAAAGDTDAAYAAIDRALELHEDLKEPFERGRTLLVLGTLQRRSRKKRAARESLTRALAVFDDLGARLWSERARAELRRVGGRAAAPGTLTATEERVAELVAAGRTYREAADALFMSPKTVQWNLSKIYRKLGVRSRAELAAKLAAEGGPRGDSPPRDGGQSPAVPPVPE